MRTYWRTLALTLVLQAAAHAQVLVNQSGYNTEESKRFTAPLAADGTPFSIVTHPAGDTIFTGSVTSGVGDFTALQPATTGEFRVVLGNPPNTESSHPFGIGPFWIERVSYRRMIQFFIDSRSGNGNATTWDVTAGKLSSGIAWRDSHQFSFELRTLIQWFAANPDAFGPDRMPPEGLYLGLRDTLPADTPEIVRLIHWGVDLYLRGQLNHTLIKEELAYFVYYYPLLQPWIPVTLYEEARDRVFSLWSDSARDRWNWYDIPHDANLLQTFTVMGGTKGSLPPGHSIVPNLLLHAVALREARPDATLYLAAARAQVQWIVDNLDPADPLVTKGQRMSEHILVPALAEFMMRDPATPVTGVDAWLSSWADTVIARSNNYWDFRKYSDTRWTPENVPGSHPDWNEPGNIAGFPASALAAVTRLTDPAKIARLRQIAVSQLDQVFGRNPHNRHFSFRAAQPTHGFEGVETGWFSQYIGGLGDLGQVRGVLDASAKHPAFPYNPGVAPGYVEGWIAFNSAWNAGMLWAARDRSSISFTAPAPQGADGELQVELVAPLNFNRTIAETATVHLASASGDAETIVLTETGPDTSVFQGGIALENAAPQSGDHSLDAPEGGQITARYAHDIFARIATGTAASTAAAPLAITTPALPPTRTGIPYGPVVLHSANGAGSPTWTLASGTLPAGIELLPSGILQGTPSEAGTFSPVFRASSGSETVEKALTLISSGLAIPSTALPDATAGQPYLGTLATSGATGPVTWSPGPGSLLPAGLALDPAGTLTGIPAATGTFNFTLNATDASALPVTAFYQLRINPQSAGLIFTDAFDADTGSWFKAAPVAGDSLSVTDGRMEWRENGASMQESIGRSFPLTTLSPGQTLRLGFDYRQTGSTSGNIIRAGLCKLGSPILSHHWAGANAVGAWQGYASFVRDNSSTGNLARVESGTLTSTTAGPTNGASGTFTNITSPADNTQFNLNDDGSVTYRFTLELHRVSATRMDTLYTVREGSGESALTRFTIAGSQTTGTVHSGFDAVVLKQAGGTTMPATYDNITLELIGDILPDPAVFHDWQHIIWPGTSDLAISGPDRDPDQDGTANLLEWALHLDPAAPDHFQPVLLPGATEISFTYLRRKTAPGEATFQVEWSDTLADDWSTAGVVTSPVQSINATTESVHSIIPAATAGRRFIRVRVHRP